MHTSIYAPKSIIQLLFMSFSFEDILAKRAKMKQFVASLVYICLMGSSCLAIEFGCKDKSYSFLRGKGFSPITTDNTTLVASIEMTTIKVDKKRNIVEMNIWTPMPKEFTDKTSVGLIKRKTVVDIENGMEKSMFAEGYDCNKKLITKQIVDNPEWKDMQNSNLGNVFLRFAESKFDEAK